MANSVPAANGIMVAPQVYPGSPGVTSPQNQPFTSNLGKFLKGEPGALGVVGIIIGIVELFFGIGTAFNALTISIYSGVMFWGAIIYITAGSLAVSASKKLTPCLVKASLGMNIISSIAAAIAIIMHSLDFIVINAVEEVCFHPACVLLGRAYSIAGVMLVLSVMEFIVSICVSVFAGQVTCRSDTEEIMYMNSQTPFYVATTHPAAAQLNTSERPPSSRIAAVHNGNTEGLWGGKPEDLPPASAEVQRL